MRIALIHRDSIRLTEKRMIGMWSYDVPQFEVEHFPMKDGFRVAASDFSDFDLIWYEDGKLQGTIEKDATVPVAYYVGDSTLSRLHYETRLKQARVNANMVFVDWDKLVRYSSLEMPVRRLSHSVNDKTFRDYCGLIKSVDVGIFMGETEERLKLNDWAANFCDAHGLTCEIGIRHHEDYAKAMARCKIVINLGRNPWTRNHRVFDAMACRTCLMTDRLPEVSGEDYQTGVHYVEYRGFKNLGIRLLKLLNTSGWEKVADNGYEYAIENHIWKVRAAQLHKMLKR